jgi:alkylation response protein AidB-like acyl-CoA dehydrogenase
VLDGDHYVINGSKIWTSGAHHADWMFILVRTNRDVPKHEGISFMLLPMDQAGVRVKPIALLSGVSTFNETFFDNALAARDDLVGELNKGWTVGKRLLQHERSGMEALVAGSTRGDDSEIQDVAREFIGSLDGKLADPVVRDEITSYQMNIAALHLTQRRVVEESQDGATPGPATSIFKVVNSELVQEYHDLKTRLRGSRAFGVDEDEFSEEEREMVHEFFFSRAGSIYSGSNEIQRNIIAKRVLGLPD